MLIQLRDINIEPDRRALVVQAVGTWSFSAHKFSDDELLIAALIIFEHALTMPELEKWRMSTGTLKQSRASQYANKIRCPHKISASKPSSIQ